MKSESICEGRLVAEMRRSPFSAIGDFLTLIQRAKLQPGYATNRIHKGSIDRQIFAVKLNLRSPANVNSALKTFTLKHDSFILEYLTS